MSVAIDPSSKTKLPFNVDPPKTEEKKNQPAVVLDAPIHGPKPDYTALLAAQKLGTTGVSSAVFGATSPNVKAMSDQTLAQNIGRLGQAMKASPGKVSADDFKALKAMIDEANLRGAAVLSSNKPVKDLDNRELFSALVMFDAAKANGMKLTPEQEKRSGALEAEWKSRRTFDPAKEKAAELKFLIKERAHLADKALTHCSAAILGATSLTSHVGALGMIGSGLVLSHAHHEKAYGTLALETSLAVAARFPMTHKPAEGVATAINTIECLAAIADYEIAGSELKRLKAK